MKLFRSISLMSVAATMLLTSGCVTGRRSIDLPTPAPSTATTGSKGDLYIGDILDQRTFENKPASPSTPSIKGDVNALSPDQRASFIGRQRGGYGNAAGDVILANHGTVTERMHALLESGLSQHGYTISRNPQAANSIKVTINRFWSWTIPEAVVVQFNAQIDATITINNNGKLLTLKVEGSGVNMGQPSDGNYQLAYTRAFDDFLNKLDQSLTTAGL